jgi:hypothetical protein
LIGVDTSGSTVTITNTTPGKKASLLWIRRTSIDALAPDTSGNVAAGVGETAWFCIFAQPQLNDTDHGQGTEIWSCDGQELVALASPMSDASIPSELDVDESVTLRLGQVGAPSAVPEGTVRAPSEVAGWAFTREPGFLAADANVFGINRGWGANLNRLVMNDPFA